MVSTLRRFFFLFSLAILVLSCSKEQGNSVTDSGSEDTAENRLLPYSTGEVNHLALYLDPSFQNNALKDSLLYYINQPYLLTPVPSPVLDVSIYDFDRYLESSLARRANNLMLVNINEDSKISDYIKQQLGNEQINDALQNKDLALVRVLDVSAKPQQVFYLLSKQQPQLTPTLIEDLRDYIQSIVEESLKIDNERLVSSMVNRRNRSLEDKIEDEFAVKLWVPKEYQVMMEEENMLWLLRETSELYSSILVYKSNAYDAMSLEERSLALRADFGKFVTTNRENSYMITHTDSKPYPIQREIIIDDTPVVETRGLWEIENDYLGGSFVNYTLKNPRGETIAIDGFVYYSEEEVRRKMRDIDAIMSTVQIPK